MVLNCNCLKHCYSGPVQNSMDFHATQVGGAHPSATSFQPSVHPLQSTGLMVPEHPHLSAPPLWALLASFQAVLVPGPFLLTHIGSSSRLQKENCWCCLSLFAVGVILLNRGNHLLSVFREAEGYTPHQLAVLDQSDRCCLGQWNSPRTG